jgi:hypothetical protein
MIEEVRTDEWLIMAEDVIRAANFRTTIAEFEHISSLKTPQAGMSIKDRLRVGQELIEMGIVELDDGRLVLANNRNTKWLEDYLVDGNQLAWGMAEILRPDQVREEKFNSELLSEIGLRGELAVLEELKKQLPIELHGKISHISLRDDRAGYDIVAPSCTDPTQTRLLEVKTSCRIGPSFRMFMSRNEFEVGCREPGWRIVLVELKDGVCTILGSVSASYFIDSTPIDQSKEIKWESIRVNLPRQHIWPSLP